MSTSHGDGLSRKRARESSTALPPLLSAWVDDADYGLIHTTGCDVCSSYMSHLAEASYSDNQPSFQIALSDRNHKREVCFYEGVTEGRRRQRADNDGLLDDLERHRAERNEALDAVGRYRLERNDAREELEYFRSKFDASKAECERLKQRVAELSREKRNEALDMEVLEVEQMLVDPGSPPVAPVYMEPVQTSLTPLNSFHVQGSGTMSIPTSTCVSTQLAPAFGQSRQSPLHSAKDLPSFSNPSFSASIKTASSLSAGPSTPTVRNGGSQLSAKPPLGSKHNPIPSGGSTYGQSKSVIPPTIKPSEFTRTTATLTAGTPSTLGAPAAADDLALKSPLVAVTRAPSTTYAAAAKDRCVSTPPTNTPLVPSIGKLTTGLVTSTRPVTPPSRPLANGTSAQSTAPVSRSGLPKNIRQLQSLMNAAHQPGNLGALKKVKALCAEAHQTSKEQKTDLHRYLLANWRNPVLAGEPPPAPAPKTNPRLEDPIELWVAYLSAHRGSWPRGVRRDIHGQPHLPDLKASRMVARLRPNMDSTSSSVSARYGFMSFVTRLFSEPGMYEQIVQRNGFQIALEAKFRRYSGPPEEITYERVACHFAECGVSFQMATQELGPWAQECVAASGTQ